MHQANKDLKAEVTKLKAQIKVAQKQLKSHKLNPEDAEIAKKLEFEWNFPNASEVLEAKAVVAEEENKEESKK